MSYVVYNLALNRVQAMALAKYLYQNQRLTKTEKEICRKLFNDLAESVGHPLTY